MGKRKKFYYYRCVKSCQLRDSNGAIINCQGRDSRARDEGNKLVGATILKLDKPLKSDLVGLEPIGHESDERRWPHFKLLTSPTERQKAAAQVLPLRGDFYA